MIIVRVTMHELVVFVCLEFAEMCIIIYQSLSFSTAFTHLLLVLPFVLQRASGDLFGSDINTLDGPSLPPTGFMWGTEDSKITHL